jgi:OOP family OmpA-OmpF porin
MKLRYLAIVLVGACSGQVKLEAKIPTPALVRDHREPAPPPPKPEPEPPLVAAPTTGAQLDVPGEIGFDLDRAVLHAEADATKETLANIVKILGDNPSITKVRVEGHTDNDGTDQFNQRLSEKRANAVVKWLIANGIEEKRLVAVGCAAKDPLVPNTSADNKAKNRRTEFDIEEIDGKPPTDYTEPCAPNPKRKPQ